jgi:hypothetical protein
MTFVLNVQDRRSLALHRAVSAHIAANPELLERVKAKLQIWRELDPKVPYYVTAWEGIMKQPLDTILGFLVEETERAADLRQSSPFTACGILTPKERWAILKEVERREAA